MKGHILSRKYKCKINHAIRDSLASVSIGTFKYIYTDIICSKIIQSFLVSMSQAHTNKNNQFNIILRPMENSTWTNNVIPSKHQKVIFLSTVLWLVKPVLKIETTYKIGKS